MNILPGNRAGQTNTKVGREKLAMPERDQSLIASRLRKSRLPWLDGKPASYRQPSIPGAFLSDSAFTSDSNGTPSSPRSNESSPAHLTMNSPNTFSKADPSIKAIGSTPVLRRKSTQASAKRRVSSAGSTNQPPVVINIVSPAGSRIVRENSTASNEEGAEKISMTFSDPGGPTAIRDSTTSSSAEFQDAVKEFQPNLSDDSPRSVPNKIKKISSPYIPTHERSFPSATKAAKKSVQLSPRASLLKRDLFERDAKDHQLDDAIDGFEDLVQEAVEMAEDAADQEKMDEVTEIIEGATNALRMASIIPANHFMVVGSPRHVSESSYSSSGVSSISEESTSDDRRSSSSSQTILTRASPPARVAISVPHKKDGRRPKSEHGDVAIEIEQPLPTAPGTSVSPTPPRFYPKQSADSVAIDWAYVPARKSEIEQQRKPSSPEGADLYPARPSRISMHDNKPLEPEPAQISTHDHENFVSRGTKRRHRSGDFEIHRKHRGSRGRDGSHDRRKEDAQGSSFLSLDEGTRPERAMRWRSSYGVSETPFDTDLEERFGYTASGLNRRPPRRSTQLSVPDQGHGFSLHRRHRRQPIARNWGPLRKRITATIACINTSLLGLIIGIYVSGHHT